VAVETEFVPLPIVHGDQVHLQQVVLNLVLNAVDAMQAVPAQRRRLSVRTARAAGGSVEIIVADTGPGVAAGVLEHLFDSFYTTKPEGMGLGLSIARSIIEAHRGTIQVETRAEEGTSFRVSLPMRPGTEENGITGLQYGGSRS